MNRELILSVTLCTISSVLTSDLQPNIMVIMADDLGWNDVSFHGSNQIPTPNIDFIASLGVILEQYYTDTTGTSARSAFDTGKYSSGLGMQGSSIKASEDRGIPLSEKLLPSYLQDLGYSTHLVGKWGLGKSRESMLPTNRGFESFFGILGEAVDYFTYNCIEICNGSHYFGIDLYEDMHPAVNYTGYLTDLITERARRLIKDHDTEKPLYLQISHVAPHAGGGLVTLQAAPETIHVNEHIAHSARRIYAGMVTSLDTSIGNTIAALAEKDMLENTIIVFVSDNGAPAFGEQKNFGNNLPFRGCKGTPWEGGVRSTALIWYAPLKSIIWEGIFHVTDWLPTLVEAAGGKVGTKIDGVSQWEAIKNDDVSNHQNILVTIDDLNSWAAIREGDYKCIIGDVSNESSVYIGEELMAMRLEAPDYEEALLQCETARIFEEYLNRTVHMKTVLWKRNDSTLVQIEDIDVAELCVPTKDKGCLFNLKEDPLEVHDIWNSSYDVVKRLTLRLRSFWAEKKMRHIPIEDPRSKPRHPDYVWAPWVLDDEPVYETMELPTSFPLQASKGELQYLVDLNFQTFKDQLANYVKNMGDSFVKSASNLFNF